MKRILSMAVALAMVASFSTIAFATDTDSSAVNTDETPSNAYSSTTDTVAATNPQGDDDSAVETGGRVSNGEATVEYSDGFYYTNDDDGLSGVEDTEGGNITVWGQVVMDGTVVYKLDVLWGSMKFTYSNTHQQWDPDTHTYVTVFSSDDATTGWTVDDLDGVNNKLTIINHSNAAVEAEVDFAFASTSADGVSNNFNTDPTVANSVVGQFYTTSDAAETAALQIGWDLTASLSGDEYAALESLLLAAYDETDADALKVYIGTDTGFETIDDGEGNDTGYVLFSALYDDAYVGDATADDPTDYYLYDADQSIDTEQAFSKTYGYYYLSNDYATDSTIDSVNDPENRTMDDQSIATVTILINFDAFAESTDAEGVVTDATIFTTASMDDDYDTIKLHNAASYYEILTEDEFTADGADYDSYQGAEVKWPSDTDTNYDTLLVDYGFADELFFAFSGTPDSDADLATMSNVGTITVTVSTYEDAEFEYDASVDPEVDDTLEITGYNDRNADDT